MRLKTLNLNYPIYSIANGENYFITSGGGGGRVFGIENLLEAHEYSATKKSFQTLFTTGEQKGVVDSIVYCEKLRLWAGCVDNCILIFCINADVGPKIIHKVPVQPADLAMRQVVVRFSANGEYLVSGGDNRNLKIWKLNILKLPEDKDSENENKEQSETLKPAILDSSQPLTLLFDLIGHEGDVKGCEISNDCKILASCASDCTLKIWNMKDGMQLHSQSLSDPQKKSSNLFFRHCKFLNSDRREAAIYKLISIGCGTRGPSYASIWEIRKKNDAFSCSLLSTTLIADALCSSFSISPSQKYYAIGFSTGKCKVYDRSFRVVCGHAAHDLPVTGTCFSHTENTLFSTGADYSLTIMNFDAEATSKWRYLSKPLFAIFFLLLLLLVFQNLITVGVDEYVESVMPTLHSNSPAFMRLQAASPKFANLSVAEARASILSSHNSDEL